MPFCAALFNIEGDMGYYERLGEILRDRLNSDEDPFAGLAEGASSGAEGKRGGRQAEEKPAPKKRARAVPVPRDLIEDFLVLGLRPGESEEECKSAWKLLLKTHHPDRHQGSESEKRMAEQATINITRSYRRIRRWFATGEVPND